MNQYYNQIKLFLFFNLKKKKKMEKEDISIYGEVKLCN
jgi:hypothetical protein